MLAAASRNVRRSLGCFSFLLSLLLLTGARKKARHWKNFEFEIPPRYAAVVGKGKARVCLSFVTSQTRCAMREEAGRQTHPLYSLQISVPLSVHARVYSSVVSGSVLLRKEELTRALLRLRGSLPCKGLERAWSYCIVHTSFTARAEPCCYHESH